MSWTISQRRADGVVVTTTTGMTIDLVRGPRGLSAYQVAQADGFGGSEAAWLDSLRGAAAQWLSLTQAEYDALTPDPDTLYIVVPE